MKRFAEQFNKQASSIRLKAAERRELQERLVAYMEYHPLPAEMRSEKKIEKPKMELASEPFLAFQFDMTIVRNFAGVFALILVVAIPMMAEKSVPGDVLYPVKVQINEEVRGSLAISPYAQVEWETERLERRLAEARLLASEGKMTEEVEAGVAEAVKEHSNNAKAGIAKIRETDEDEAAIAEIAFASALAVQSEVLEGHVEKEVATEGEVGHSIAAIVSLVSEEQQAAEATQAGVKPSYEKLLGRVEVETTKAYELFATVADYASTEEVADIERRLDDIERKMLKAISLHEELSSEPVATEPKTETEPVEIEAEEDDPVSEIEEVPAEVLEEDVAEEVESGEVVEEVSSVDDVDTDTDETAKETEEIVEPTEEPVVVPADETNIDQSEAVELLREVLVDTKKLISFMTSIDVRVNVSIEELVPVTLTDDERIVEIKDTISEVKKLDTELNKRVVNKDVVEKYRNAKTKMDSLVTTAEDAMINGDLKQSQTMATEALTIARDLYQMTGGEKPVVKPEDELTTEEPALEETEVSAEDDGASAEEAAIE